MIGAALTLLAETGWDHMDFNGGWWIVMGLGMILFWGLVILGIVWLVREVAGSGHASPGRASDRPPDPLATLDHRLAAGEISPDEYRERRAVLRGDGSRGSSGAGAG